MEKDNNQALDMFIGGIKAGAMAQFSMNDSIVRSDIEGLRKAVIAITKALETSGVLAPDSLKEIKKLLGYQSAR